MKTLTLKPWQELGVQWLITPTLASGEGHKYLMDEPALGKTVQVAVALKRLGGTSLIICPKNVKDKNGWRQRLMEWGTYADQDIQIIRSSKDTIDWSKRCVILNPELALRDSIRRQLQHTLFDTLVVDEGHVAKNCNSKIAQKILSVRHGKPFIACAKRTWGVSGTPTPNGRPLELFPWLSTLARECLGRFTTQQLFGDRYCGGEAMSFTGATNKDELAAQLQPFILARKLRDVEPDIPTVSWEHVYIDVGDMLEDDSNTETATLRRLVAERSAPFVGEFINELMVEHGERVVVFCHHSAVIAKICEITGGRPFEGGQSEKQRDEIVNWWKANKLPLVVQYTAGGVALDGLQHLTRIVVFAEPDYVPDLQAVRRIERMGQQEPILAFRMLAEKPMHRKMSNMQNNKKQNILEIIKTMAKAKNTTGPILGMLEQFFSDVTSIADSLVVLANNEAGEIPKSATEQALGNIPTSGNVPAADAQTTPAAAQTAASVPAAADTTPVALTVEDVRTAAKETLSRYATKAEGEKAVNQYFLANFGKNKTGELDPSTYATAIAGLKALTASAPAPTVANDI